MKAQRGFTLVELLVAVALIGILASLGIFLLRAKPRAIDVAHEISAKIAEASRKAVAAGAVRQDVAVALNSKARTRTMIYVATGGGTITVERLEEDSGSPTASWVMLSSKTLHPSVIISGFRVGADLTGGVTAPAVAVAAGSAIELRCKPDGTCDPMTIYVSSYKGQRTARVVVMPLGGSPATFEGW